MSVPEDMHFFKPIYTSIKVLSSVLLYATLKNAPDGVQSYQYLLQNAKNRHARHCRSPLSKCRSRFGMHELVRAWKAIWKCTWNLESIKLSMSDAIS